MFNKLKDENSDFYQRYLRSFAARSSCTSAYVESENSIFEDYNSALAISGLMDACNELFFHNSFLRISPFDLPHLVNLITNGVIQGYRTTEVMINGKNTKLSLPKNIIADLYILFDNYYNIWSYMDDPYLRESLFHIKLLKIHPFEDGNGRTARLLTSYNFINSQIPPVIIPKAAKEEYCKYIEKDDYEGLAKFFKVLSEKEKIVMEAIAKEDTKKFS